MTKTLLELGGCLPTLDVGRVRLRWLTNADIPSLFGIFGDPEVTRYWGFAILPDLAAAAVLLEQIHQGFQARTLFQWGIEATGGPLVGTCTLSQLDSTNRRAELGFALGRAFWGRGYMAAALPAVIEFAFVQLGLQRLFADVDPRNAPSIRALEGLGFRREGVLREHYLVQSDPQDAIVYGLLRREWVCSEASLSNITMNTTDMKHYRSSEWNFALDIPRRWHSMPPQCTNSPYEVMRFLSKEDGTHVLIVFREIHDPKQAFQDVSDAVQKVLASHGFGNFVPGKTTIGPRAALTLDFDKPKDGGTWSCRHYFVADGTLRYTLGFGTTNKAEMFELYDHMAKSFEFQAE